MRLTEMDVDKDGQQTVPDCKTCEEHGCFVDCFAHEEGKEGLGEYAKLRLRLIAHYDGRIAVSVLVSRNSLLFGRRPRIKFVQIDGPQAPPMNRSHMCV